MKYAKTQGKYKTDKKDRQKHMEKIKKIEKYKNNIKMFQKHNEKIKKR